MKFFSIIALCAIVGVAGCVQEQGTVRQRREAQPPPPSHDAVSYQVFYDELSPYGVWVDNPAYGFVWMPNVEPGFSPYCTAGHWVFTDYGWTWDSDYPWGWAAFHYGRWDYQDEYGWFWVPDERWGPAWVAWRQSSGYYGWAPLRPGIEVTATFGRDYRERDERWTFVHDYDMASPDMSRRFVDRMNNVTIINSSTVIVNVYQDKNKNSTYITGPDRGDVQRRTRTPVPMVTIRDYDRPGQHRGDGDLEIYRPRVQRTNQGAQRPAPPRVINWNDARRGSGTSPGGRQRQPNAVPPGRGEVPGDNRPAPQPPGRERERQQPVPAPPVTRERATQPPVISHPAEPDPGTQRPAVPPKPTPDRTNPPPVMAKPATPDRTNPPPVIVQPSTPDRGRQRQGQTPPAARERKQQQPQKTSPPQKNNGEVRQGRSVRTPADTTAHGKRTREERHQER